MFSPDEIAELEQPVTVPSVEERLQQHLPEFILRVIAIGNNEHIRADTRLKALKELISRAMGQPPARMEITGAGGGPIKIVAWMPSQELIEQRAGEVIEAAEVKAVLPQVEALEAGNED